MPDETTKKYSNGEITVIWKPKLCTHSTNCWKGLGTVFNPKVRPWVNMEGGSTEQIINQVNACPSGALSYVRNDTATPEPATPAVTIIEASPNGPLLVSGDVTIRHGDGTETQIRRKTALCRCGQSGNKPFCDGSHTKAGFKA